MEQEYQIPTDQSIEIETTRNSHLNEAIPSEPTTFTIDKLISHLNFTQMEFMRNI